MTFSEVTDCSNNRRHYKKSSVRRFRRSVVSVKVVLNADDLQFIGFIMLSVQAVVAVM